MAKLISTLVLCCSHILLLFFFCSLFFCRQYNVMKMSLKVEEKTSVFSSPPPFLVLLVFTSPHFSAFDTQAIVF